MKRSGPIKRRTPLKRGGRLRVRSKKRQKEETQYNKRVKEWKLENPFCKACIHIFGHVAQPDQWYGDRYPGPVMVPHRTDDCHHMARRHGKLLMDERWWLPVCRWAHDWIHEHPNEARKLGLLSPR